LQLLVKIDRFLTEITAIAGNMDDFYERLAKMVRFHRKKAKLTQRELARLAGIGKTVVYDLEKGKKTIRLNTLLSILHMLNIKINFQSPFMHKFEESDEKS
jgi:HTH-type transcriptional regulator/antitoxin HipB